MQRIIRGRPAKGILLSGLRGVGKTVLLRTVLNNLKSIEDKAFQPIWVEAPEGRSLPAMLAPQLRRVLKELSLLETAGDRLQRAFGALGSFIKRCRVKYQDIEVVLEGVPHEGHADSGDLEQDLPDLFAFVGEAAKAAGKGIVLFIDDLQYIPTDQFAALITALHRCQQEGLPVGMLGAGLPHVRALAGNAKSYAERLFDFPQLGPLNDEDSRAAIARPLHDEDVAITAEALDEIVRRAQGYPYFLQEWGKQTWDVAEQSPIQLADAQKATDLAIAALDAGFFLVRLERLTPSERRYLNAMAALGPGPYRTGDIADQLGRTVQSLAPTRAKLIAKGMIWSQSYGDAAFTVPMFDQFLKRTLPRA